MSSFSKSKNLLIVGIGHVGFAVFKAIQQERYKAKFHVFVLVREKTLEVSGDSKSTGKQESVNYIKNKHTFNMVTIIPGDLSMGEAKLKELIQLYNIDIVISCAGGNASTHQSTLYHAALSSSSVRLFIPSEFSGFEQSRLHEVKGSEGFQQFIKPMLLLKEELKTNQDKLPWLSVKCGFFVNTEFMLGQFGGLNLDKQLIEAPGSFDTAVSGSTLTDLGGNIIEVILNAETRNQDIELSSWRATYSQIADAVELHTGKKLERKIVTEEEALNRVKSGNFLAVFALIMMAGIGAPKSHESSWNVKYKTGYETSLEDSIKQFL